MTRLIMMQCCTAYFICLQNFLPAAYQPIIPPPLPLYNSAQRNIYKCTQKNNSISNQEAAFATSKFGQNDNLVYCTQKTHVQLRSIDQSSQSCHQRLHALELFTKLPDVLSAVLILSAACLGNQCHTFGLGFGNLALQ